MVEFDHRIGCVENVKFAAMITVSWFEGARAGKGPPAGVKPHFLALKMPSAIPSGVVALADPQDVRRLEKT